MLDKKNTFKRDLNSSIQNTNKNESIIQTPLTRSINKPFSLNEEMGMADAIYNYDKRIAGSLRRLECLESYHKSKIVEFYRYLVACGLSKARIDRLLQMMKTIGLIIDKPFDECKKEDIVKLVAEIENKDWSDWTKRMYRIAIKKFWKWLKDLDYYPIQVKWIKNGKVRNKPVDILTVEEVERLVEVADNIRDKTLVAIMYESGCRIGEILTLRLKNVQFDEHGAIIMVNGKTGWRPVRIVQSAKFLKRWINLHPFKDYPEYPLFVNCNNDVLTHQIVRKILRRLAKRIKLKKRIYPYLFRHSRISHTGNFLTDSQRCTYFGLVKGSKMLKVYDHLNGRDIDDAILKMNGIKSL